MDIISHGLWGGLAAGRASKKYYYLAVLFGALPDVIPFAFEYLRFLLGVEDAGFGPLDEALIPGYVSTLYNFTHSLVIFALVFGVVWLFRGKPFIPLAAWGVHVLLDIFSHTTDFFATPFLWPISNFRVDGISWLDPLVFFPNLALLVILYFWWYLSRRKSS